MNYDLDRTSIIDVFNERRRLLEQDPTLEGDDLCVGGELVWAALAYLVTPGEMLWPFAEGYDPDSDPIKNLIKAGALISAEADRLKRRQIAGLPVVASVVVLAMDPDEILATVNGALGLQRELADMKRDAT